MDDGLVALRAGRLVDVVAGEVLADRVVLLRGERVVAVGGAELAAPAARQLDLSGYTVLPGLIDCHTHLVGEVESAGLPAIGRSGAQEALAGVRNAGATVRAGFTTVRDVGTYRAFVDVALRDAIDAGVVPGPRMAVAG